MVKPMNGKVFVSLLLRVSAPVWGKPVKLFNGKDLAGWKAVGRENQWQVINGILTSPRSGANLITEQSSTILNYILNLDVRKEAIAVFIYAEDMKCR